MVSDCLLVLGPLNTTCGHDHAGVSCTYGIFEVNGSIGNCGVSGEMSRVLQDMHCARKEDVASSLKPPSTIW